MTTFSQYAQQTQSEKVVLATIQSIVQVKLFDNTLDPVYSKVVPFFVVAVQEGTSYYTQAENATLNASEFYYDIQNSTLHIRTSDDSDPVTKEIFLTYRHFYSSKPVLLPYDLDSGAEVEWDGRIKDIGELTLEVDSENTGIAVESDSSIKLENTDGYFDSIFDTHIWENQEAKFYSWSPSITAIEAKLIYNGLINNKTFSSKEVGFSLKDLLFKLRSTVPYTNFENQDGSIDEENIGKPKTIVIGRASKLKCEGIDKILDGFSFTPSAVQGSADRNLLTGTMNGSIGSPTITGVGTLFLSQLTDGAKIRFFVGSLEYNYTVQSRASDTSLTLTGNVSATFNNATARNMSVLNNIVTGTLTTFKTHFSPQDKLVVSVNDTEYKYRILSVDSDTQMTLDDEIKATFNVLTAKNLPEIPYRRVNRIWNIAGHPLRTYTTTVLSVIDSQWIEVSDIGEIETDDVVSINGYLYTCNRVSFDKIQLNQAAFAPISVNDEVIKIPVFKAYYGENELVYNRDYTLGTLIDGSTNLELDDLAEFNITQSKTMLNTYIFTNGTSTITCSDNTVDLTELFKPRDWIKPKTVTIQNWNEILSVSQTTITLRSNYTDATYTGVTDLKSPSYISDDSLICVDCIGLEHTFEASQSMVVNNVSFIEESQAAVNATINSDLYIDSTLIIGDSAIAKWVKTPSQAVKWILDKVGIENQDASSFSAANDACQNTMCLIYQNGSVKSARDMITDINKSCFGSLYLNSDFSFCFNVLNVDMDEDIEELTDSDIISFSVATKQNITNEVLLEYGQTTNLANGEVYFQKETISNGYVDKTSKIKNQLSFKVFLYHALEARNMALRLLLFKGNTQTTVTVKSKLNLYLKSINDRMYLSLDRLFTRFGSSIRKKIGIINKISKDELGTSVQFNDMGGIYSKVAVIAPNTTPDYGSASDIDLTRYAFICENNTETPDAASEADLGCNLIG